MLDSRLQSCSFLVSWAQCVRRYVTAADDVIALYSDVVRYIADADDVVVDIIIVDVRS